MYYRDLSGQYDKLVVLSKLMKPVGPQFFFAQPQVISPNQPVIKT